ncbi:MAG: RnfABCDGE type electron transport complex subunit B [Clostridia bacterium]|nr:RnfABCDGE type electron transport complex subunit B [Clostridia bacterium]
MLSEILYPALSIGAIGLFFGAVLAFASIVFKVDKDERIDLINEELPGANCGGCGYAGCSALAQAIVENGENPGKCNLMTQEKAQIIASIMGTEAAAVVNKTAVVVCGGKCDICENKCETYGIDDCYTAAQFGTGPKNCEYGCMGLGSCVKVCPENAISIIDGIAFIDKEKCIGCGKCESECPKSVIKLVPDKRLAIVKCMSKDKGAIVKDYCSAGCIGCRICEKKCPKEAITIENNLAIIDNEKCVGCGICAKECPKGAIEMINI